MVLVPAVLAHLAHLAYLTHLAHVSSSTTCAYTQLVETTTTDSCKHSVSALQSQRNVSHSLSVEWPTRVKVSRLVDGWLNGEVFVGTYTSQLQTYIDTAFAPITEANYSDVSLFNSSKLNTLHLTGKYLCDKPLRLPSMFVLNGSGMTLTPATNLSLDHVPRFAAMVMLSGVTLSAIIGGTFDASTQPPPPVNSHGYMAISITGAPGKNAVRHVRALANNTDASIGIHSSPHAEVSFSDVGGASGLMHGRCIWTLATSAALVHDNYIRNCSKHSLDFDAYTSFSAAYSNTLIDHGQEGIFVEESASGNFVFNNTIHSSATGIGVYSNVVGPVANNMIIGNTIVGNGQGLSAGGVGHDPKKQSQNNIFASNHLEANDGGGSQVNPSHGAVSGDFWTSNNVVGSDFPYRQPLPANYAGVTLFDP